jgi:hypothetical protein
MIVRSGSSVQNAGTGFELKGNLQVDGTMNYNSATNPQLNFTSSTAQSISGAGTISIYAMQVNKSAGALILSKAISIDNVLTFTSGNIISTSANLLTINNGATVSGGSTTSFVSGPIQKIGNSAFTFPVGKGTDYQNLTITAPSNATDAFTAEYFSSAQTDGTATDYTLSNLSTCEYWNLARTTGTSNVSVTLSWNSGSCLTTTPANMRVAYWNSGSSLWKDEGGTVSTGTSSSGTIKTTSAQTGFGHFALANLNTNAYFRSTASGNWNATSTWQASADNTTWQTALSTPDYNSNTISIQSGHTVTITSSVTIDQTVVNGTLVYGDFAGSTLTLNDGTGTDLIVNGTFQDIGPNSNVWSGSSSWSIGTAGTLLRTRATSSDNWRDHYQGGISTIPSTATWLIRKTGTDNPLVSSVGAMYYPNLTIENTSGSAWTASGSSVFTGSTDYPRITGNLDIGGAGTSGVTFSTGNTNATAILVQGNVIVRSASTLQNAGTGFQINGNLQVDGVLNYGASNGRNLIFGAGSAQTLSGAGTISIYALQINKSAGALTLSKAIGIDNVLTLTAGNIISTSTNLLTINNGGSVSGTSASSFVSGPVQKIGNAAFVFPTGKSSDYQPVTITAPANATDAFTAEYFNTAQTDGSATDYTLTNLSTCEYWDLSRTTGTSTVSVILGWNSSSCLTTTPANMRVALWNATASRWNDEGGASSSGTSSTGTTTSAAPLSSFGDLALANLGSTNDYYRSASTGNWNSTSTWQASVDNITWQPAITVPDFNSNTITVQMGHTVTITSNVTLDQTIVNGTLVYGDNAGSVLTINDGTGDDLIINGTYQDFGPTTNVWSGSSTWLIGSTGTLVRSRSTSSDAWMNHYSGGIATIPATSNWIVRKTGTDNPAITSVGGMYYPNLTIENTSGSAWTAAGSSIFTGSSDYPRILGTFDMGGAGTSTVYFTNQNTNATPIPVGGDLIIRAGSTLLDNGTGFAVAGNIQAIGTYILGHGLSVPGNITISAGGTLNANNQPISVGGNWIDNGMFTPGTSTVTFNGTGNQTIQNSTGAETFSSLLINKTTGLVQLNGPVTVTGVLTLTQGIVLTTSINLMTLSSGASIAGGSDQSMVSGPMQKIGNTAFNFPIGDYTLFNAPYHPIALSAPTNPTDAFLAQYFSIGQGFGSLMDSSMQSLDSCEYWTVNQMTGSSDVNIILNWNNTGCLTGVPSTYRLAGWNGTNWTDLGNDNLTTTSSGGNLRSHITVHFSGHPIPFTFGTTTSHFAYAEMKRKLDAGFIIVKSGTLGFRYEEEYTGGNLNFKIYDKNNQAVTQTSVVPPNTFPVKFGDNRYVMDLTSSSIVPTGSLPGGFYILEVMNEKNEKMLLRFRNDVSNPPCFPCPVPVDPNTLSK